MSILDTFYLLFKSDAKELDKGLEETRSKAKKTTEELKAADAAAYHLGESIGRSLRSLAGHAAGYLAIHALTGSFMHAVEAADKLDETAERLGVDIELLGQWGDVVKKNGGSTEAFVSSIESLNKAMSMMEVTGKSRVAPFFKELGIDLEAVENKGKTAMDFLPQIADAFEDMDKQKSVAIGQKLGLDMGTIMTLQQGKREVEELLAKERALGVITERQGKLAGAWGDQLDDTRHALRSLWLEVSTAVLPVMTWLAKKFEELFTFMRENKDLIIGVMLGIGGAIAYFALPPLLAMAAAAVLALAPFLAIAAAVAAVAVAFGLLYDDVVNFLEGNDSLIGQLLEKYPELRAVLEGIGDTFKWLASVVSDVAQIIWASLGLVFNAVGDLFVGIIKYWIEHLGFLKPVFQAVGDLFAGIVKYWIDLITQFIDKFGGIVAIAKSVGGAISGALGSAKAALGIAPAPPGPRQESGATGPYGVGLPEGKAQLGAISASPMGTQSSAATTNTKTSNKTTNVNVGEVKVQTQATDAAGISKSIGDSIGTQMRQAASNYDDGVAA